MLQDIELLESGSILKGLRFPHKIKKVTQIVITAGQLSCLVDFRMWTLKAPAVALFLPGQVVESLETDDKIFERSLILIIPLLIEMPLEISSEDCVTLPSES